MLAVASNGYNCPTMTVRIFHTALAVTCAILVAGCTSLSTSGLDTQSSNVPPGVKPGHEPLFEAKDREQMVCHSTMPLSAQMPLADIPFECDSIRVTATITEMRDAGWRLEAIDVGQESNIDGVITMPLKITIRKLL